MTGVTGVSALDLNRPRRPRSAGDRQHHRSRRHGATASVQDYIFTFKVTANDVAEYPLGAKPDRPDGDHRPDAKRHALRRRAWVGSPLFGATGAGDTRGCAPDDRSIADQRRLALFTNITSSGESEQPFHDVVQAPGSIINVSGGFTQFTGAKVATTELVTANGEIVNIANADPFMPYAGIAGQFVVDHPHWGPTDTETFGVAAAQASAAISIRASLPAPAPAISRSPPAIRCSKARCSARQSPAAARRKLAESDTGPNGSQATIDQLPQDASLTILW